MNHRGPTDQEQTDLYACDHCGRQMSVTEDICPRCGKVYDSALPKRPRGGTRMSTWDKLDWLTRNAFATSLGTNDHRSGTIDQHSPSAKEAIENVFEDDFDDDEEGQALKAECIRRDHIVTLQVYPTNSVGFYRAVHWDLKAAVEQIYETVHKEIILERKYKRGR